MKITQKTIILFLTFFLFSCNSLKSQTTEIGENEILEYEKVFKDLEKYLANENGKLWNHQLYGPLFFVNPESRTIIANEKDSKGILIKNGAVYTGVLPNEINISNTALNWNGKRWTMVHLPLPNDYNKRLSLLTHELFHSIQPEVGFANLKEESCDHLDKMEGRIYLKLELEALKMALGIDDKILQKEHIKNALLFRAYRHQLYLNAKENENSQELNEGLAEYTGTILSDRNDKNLKAHYVQAIANLYEFPTFVRSFAYKTIPVYGYYMKERDETWNLEISLTTNLTDYILNFFNISIPVNIKDSVFQIREEYNYTQINNFETKREEEQIKLLAVLDKKFQENPILTIPFQNMSIGFDIGNLIPYRDLGTVYPNLRITDNWGILTAEKGALVTNNWQGVVVSEPTEITDKIIKGEGWNLELNKGWKLIKVEDNYIVKKK